MKLVQIGILIALILVGALLFQVYRGQQRQQAAAPAVAPAPAASAPAQPEPAPVAIPAEPAQPSPRKAAGTRPAPASARTAPAAAATAVQPAPSVQPAQSEPQQAAQIHTTPAPPAVAQTAVTQTPAAAPRPAPPAEIHEAAPAPPPAPRSVTVAAGTLISARLADTLASDKVKAGDSFTATLDRPLAVDGLVIAERGARVTGRVVEAVESGRVRGVASLAIQLVELTTSDGQRVAIQTDPFRKEADSTRKEDAAKVGGGAGLGAVIGAIAGGGKGAAIGAAIGGAAGAGTVAATRGKPAVLPSETRIDFRVSQPVTVTERR